MVQEVRPPLIPDDAHVMTVLINHPPGAAGYPPHRLPGGPAFGYMIDGEMLFELEGVAPRVLRAGDAFWGPAATRSTIRTLTTALTFLVASSSQCCACPRNRCANGLPKRSLRSERDCASPIDWVGHSKHSDGTLVLALSFGSKSPRRGMSSRRWRTRRDAETGSHGPHRDKS